MQTSALRSASTKILITGSPVEANVSRAARLGQGSCRSKPIGGRDRSAHWTCNAAALRAKSPEDSLKPKWTDYESEHVHKLRMGRAARRRGGIDFRFSLRYHSNALTRHFK